jgi:predicted DNA-binding transcriptional regulator AlpA
MDNPKSPVPEPFVDAKRVAEHLGFSAGTVIRMAHRGAIPTTPYKSGKKTYFRFKLSEIDAEARAQQSPPSTE